MFLVLCLASDHYCYIFLVFVYCSSFPSVLRAASQNKNDEVSNKSRAIFKQVTIKKFLIIYVVSVTEESESKKTVQDE